MFWYGEDAECDFRNIPGSCLSADQRKRSEPTVDTTVTFDYTARVLTVSKAMYRAKTASLRPSTAAIVLSRNFCFGLEKYLNNI
jgi:hypothetical protein